MEVELIQTTTNPIKFMADIASICYGHEEAKNPQKLVENLNKLGHHSVFEHVNYTFKIEGISRACLGQLTRHRHASYTVRSQRYCDEGDTEFIFPDIFKDKLAKDKVNNLIMDTKQIYSWLIGLGMKREDARMILPMSTATDLYMTLNLRELIHVYELRTHKSAQQEINELLTEMIDEVLSFTPELRFLFTFKEEED